jgi:hypothetical protein
MINPIISYRVLSPLASFFIFVCEKFFCRVDKEISIRYLDYITIESDNQQFIRKVREYEKKYGISDCIYMNCIKEFSNKKEITR